MKSSIDWCEKNYIHSDYIAEYYNSLTGACLIISSFICLHKFQHPKLVISQLLLLLVGVGTILFHGTLLYIWQLLDEIPMLLIVIEYLKIVYPKNASENENASKNVYRFYPGGARPALVRQNAQRNLNSRSGKVCGPNLYYVFIPIIVGSYFINTNLQIICFQGVFIGYTLLTLKGLRNVNIPKNKKNNKIGLALLISSSLIWSIENNFCKYYPDYIQLHAVWHILTSIGMYYINMIMFNILVFREKHHLINEKDYLKNDQV
jgi:hypothetical protein